MASEIRQLNQQTLDIHELESRIELMMVAANDECWSHTTNTCDCLDHCNNFGQTNVNVSVGFEGLW